MLIRNKLVARHVATLPPGKYGDGDGLWLVKSSNAAGQWVFRIHLGGRRREMGLGSIDRVSLAEARQLARDARNLVHDGRDPLRERAERRRLAAKREVSFAELTQLTFESRRAQLKRDGEAGRWLSPLVTHVLPKIGSRPAEKITQHDIVEVLKPLWHRHASVAAKALDRIGIVIMHGAAIDLDVDVTAKTKARAILGKQKHTVTHIAAMPWQEIPAFYKQLCEESSKSALALRLAVLTACRSQEVRGARIKEIDGDVWTVPAVRMKGGHAHRVPLSDEAKTVIRTAGKIVIDGHLFPGRPRGAISDMTMNMWLKRRDIDYRPHGFRASFRTWAAEVAHARREVAEAALAHIVGGKVERSYSRSDYLDERRELMQRWADFVTGTAL